MSKEGAEKIDEDWSIIKGTQDIYRAEKENFEKERELLRKRFGKEPSENDVTWGILNKNLLEHSKNKDWGLYRNTRFNMAEILRKEMKLERALQIYLEVCYIDLNGPENLGGLNDPILLKEYPAFDPQSENSPLAPGVLKRIDQIIRKLDFNKNKIKSIFVEHNSRIEKSLKLPLSAEKGWKLLEKEFYDSFSDSFYENK